MGENLSLGERQLISIARALLRRSKIVLIDEATANIDDESEKLITKSLEQCFADCLVLTIAHKVKTVLKSDKILVLDKGFVVEFDSPQKLLSD